MLTQPRPVLNPIPPDSRPPVTRIGVGIDTSRYGHYAAFLRDDLQTAAPELAFAESGAGYQQLHLSSCNWFFNNTNSVSVN